MTENNDLPAIVARVRELDAEYRTKRGMVIRCTEIDSYYRTAAPQLADECERLRERVGALEEALRPLATASFVSSVAPVYVIGARYGAPYDQHAAASLREEVETLKMLLPPVGSITFPPGCAKYEEAKALFERLEGGK